MTATNQAIELYYTGIHETMPFDGVPDDDIEFVADFGSLEEAAGWADANGRGWYLWSCSDRGMYIRTICVMQGSPAEIQTF